MLSEIAGALGLRRAGPDRPVGRVVVNSRGAGRGDLFVALRGSRTDGHRFVREATARRAAVLVEEADAPGPGGPALFAASSLDALGALAATVRSELTARVVGITGSNGKTTTKDFTAAVAATRWVTHASPRSFNNEVGVPLTILGAAPDTEVLVCEIGAGAVGEIAALCRIVRPEIGIVTNIGVAHLETFGSRANVERAKGELVESLPERGVAVLNVDDPRVRRLGVHTSASVVTFGRGDADVRARRVRLDGEGRASFVLEADGEAHAVRLPAPGAHLVADALAAVACGLALGVRPGPAAHALERARLSPWRMEVLRSPSGVVVVNDSYNANPDSVAAALRAAAGMNPRRLVAVLGPMAQLGSLSGPAHERVGALAARLGACPIVAVGPEGAAIRRGALAHRGSTTVLLAADAADAERTVRRIVRPGDVVLVKGSRISGLERVALSLAGRQMPSAEPY